MRTTFVIDGFNFYHSIKKLDRAIRWFDYWGYCTHFLKADDTIQDIFYCTAVATWKNQSSIRHRLFINVCKAKGIKVVEGKFKVKNFPCPHCKKQIEKHEEKETDVNIALTAYRAAKTSEKVIIVSGDSYLAPAIKAIKADYPKVTVGVIFPYNRVTGELRNNAHFHHKTKQTILSRFLLPDLIIDANGKIFTPPEEWQSH